jgi:2-phospho-L-lactate guanylyltransferase (CobY/MobA/RfbA family)
MTTIAVLAEPPREGLVATDLAATSPLTEAEAAECYAAMLADVFVAVSRSGGELLVNYRPDDLLPADHVTDTTSEAAVRAVAASALDDPSDVRFEPQVGSTFDARAGNTVTHLLREEGVNSVAVVEGSAPFLTRTLIDNGAMKLRRAEVVLGPSTGGRRYYAGFTDPIDFDGAFARPAVETLTARGRSADHEVDFLPVEPVIETGEDLLDTLPILNARIDGERNVPANTAAFFDDLNLRVSYDEDEPRLVRN